MQSYQKKKEEVKGRVEIIDEAAVLETATRGLKNLCLELGMEVFYQLLELDVERLAGKRGQHDPERGAYRHGTEKTKVVLGGEKRQVDKPRVRSKEGVELPLSSLELFRQEDALNEAILSRLLSGLSTRKYQRCVEHGGEDSACTSKSEVSRRYIAGMEQLMEAFFNRPIEGEYPVIMIDGMTVKDMSVIAAMGIAETGEKRMLGLICGATENNLVVKDLLADLIKRGLRPNVLRLFVLDGAKALHKAVSDTFGKCAVIQRCQVHKKRNVLSYLPQSEQTNVGLAISKACLEFDFEEAHNQLLLIAGNLENCYPNAANSLLEGLDETLTVHRLKVPAKLRRTLSNTNAMESANSVAASCTRRVTNWRDGEMILRHMAAGYLEAERGFRRITGYREIPFLLAALNESATNSNIISA
jgi:transposase-like protein